MFFKWVGIAGNSVLLVTFFDAYVTFQCRELTFWITWKWSEITELMNLISDFSGIFFGQFLHHYVSVYLSEVKRKGYDITVVLICSILYTKNCGEMIHFCLAHPLQMMYCSTHCFNIPLISSLRFPLIFPFGILTLPVWNPMGPHIFRPPKKHHLQILKDLKGKRMPRDFWPPRWFTRWLWWIMGSENQQKLLTPLEN